MDRREVQELVNQHKPTPEEHVDIECANCAGQWASTPDTTCFAPAEGINEVTFTNFVGHENCHMMEDGSEVYSCPNGCNYMGVPKKLHNIVEVGNPTPTDRWEYAQLIYKRQQLTAELDNIETSLGNYEGMYF